MTMASTSECPNASFVEAEVTRVVGRPWQELGAHWRRARASVRAEAGGFRLRMSVLTQGGAASERNILAASCTEATEVAVAILTTGVALEGSSGDVGSATTSAEGPSGAGGAGGGGGAGTPPGSDQNLTSAPPSVESSLQVRPLLGARLGLDVGTLGAVAPFAELDAGVELGRFAALAFVGATGRVLGELEGAAQGAQMFLLMGGLAGCFRVTRPNPVVSGCAGVELGSLEASGFGAASGGDGRAFWSASFGQGVLDWYITEASAASLGVTAVVPFRELQVTSGTDEVHRTPAVAVRPWLGLGLRFQ